MAFSMSPLLTWTPSASKLGEVNCCIIRELIAVSSFQVLEVYQGRDSTFTKYIFQVNLSRIMNWVIGRKSLQWRKNRSKPEKKVEGVILNGFYSFGMEVEPNWNSRL
jgi:hypothetical protein